VQTVVSKTDNSVELKTESYDIKEDTVLYSADVKMTCKNGKWYIDMSKMLDKSALSANKDMQIEVSSDELEVPQNPTVGQKFNDATVTATISNQGFKIMTMTVTVSNRVVEKKESIKTSAGTFDCYKLTYDVQSGMGFMKINTKTAEWYSEKAGSVRTETYDKKGNLMGYSEITSIK